MLTKMEEFETSDDAHKTDVTSTSGENSMVAKTPKSRKSEFSSLLQSMKLDMDASHDDVDYNVTVRKRKRRVSNYVSVPSNQPDTLSTPLKLFTPDPEIEDLVSCVKAGNECSPKLIMRPNEQEHAESTQPHKRRRLSMPIQSLHSSNFDPMNLFTESPLVADKFIQKKIKRKRRSLMLPPRSSGNVPKPKNIPFIQPPWNSNKRQLLNGHNKQDNLKESKIPVSKSSSLFQNGLEHSHKTTAPISTKKALKLTSENKFKKKLQNNIKISSRNSSQRCQIKLTKVNHSRSVVIPNGYNNEDVLKQKIGNAFISSKDGSTTDDSNNIFTGPIKPKDSTDKLISGISNKPASCDDIPNHINDSGSINGSLFYTEGNNKTDIFHNKFDLNPKRYKKKSSAVTCTDKCKPISTNNIQLDNAFEEHTEKDIVPDSLELNETCSNGYILSRKDSRQNFSSNLELQQNCDFETKKLSQNLYNDKIASDLSVSFPPETIEKQNSKMDECSTEDHVECTLSENRKEIVQISSIENVTIFHPSDEIEKDCEVHFHTEVLKMEKVDNDCSNNNIPASESNYHSSSVTSQPRICSMFFTKLDMRSDTEFENDDPDIAQEYSEYETIFNSGDNNRDNDKIRTDKVESPESIEEEATTPKRQDGDDFEMPTVTRKTRSKKRIINNLPKLQVRHTPMGLPKPLREKKEKFSIEEIYLNKNFKTPTEKKWETIFEYPKKNKDGTISNYEKRKKRRLCYFTTDPSLRKKNWKKNKVKTNKRKKNLQNIDADKILAEKLINLDLALKLADLSP
ncbi:uncharacterized protein LOC120344667 [Styela clava]